MIVSKAGRHEVGTGLTGRPNLPGKGQGTANSKFHLCFWHTTAPD